MWLIIIRPELLEPCFGQIERGFQGQPQKFDRQAHPELHVEGQMTAKAIWKELSSQNNIGFKKCKC